MIFTVKHLLPSLGHMKIVNADFYTIRILMLYVSDVGHSGQFTLGGLFFSFLFTGDGNSNVLRHTGIYQYTW